MAISKKKYGYNQEPRLSANQLAEYLNATPNRRKGIVRDAKYPKTSIVARYDGAWNAITKYLCNDGRPSVDLVDAMERQTAREKKPGATPWVQQDARLSIEAIDAFMKSYNKLGLTKLSCKPITGSQPKLSISGVDISVSLNATTHRKETADEPLVGGMILVFSKAEASTAAREQRCRTSAVLATLFAAKHLTASGAVDPKLCFSLDVFACRMYPAPGSYVKRLSHMEVSCEEVALRWPTIDPPDDFDG